MISATFIFKPGTYDEEFIRLDGIIAKENTKNSEYLGKDSWENKDKGLRCVVYYYKSMKGISELKNIDEHKEAKGKYRKWYEGYHVIFLKFYLLMATIQ